jgi:hypothetical protein
MSGHTSAFVQNLLSSILLGSLIWHLVNESLSLIGQSKLPWSHGWSECFGGTHVWLGSWEHGHTKGVLVIERWKKLQPKASLAFTIS